MPVENIKIIDEDGEKVAIETTTKPKKRRYERDWLIARIAHLQSILDEIEKE